MYGTGENGWERREEERGEKMVRCRGIWSDEAPPL